MVFPLTPALADTLRHSFENIQQELLERLPHLIIGLITLFLAVLVGQMVLKAICVAGRRTRLDVNLASLLGKLARAVIIILGLLVVSVIVFPGFRPGDLIAGVGITSIAVGFAFKDILQNFFAGILILWRRPFVIGDEIRYREFEGTVEDINVRSTRLRTYDGELAVLPNADVYSSAVLVRTAAPSRRLRFSVGIGYPDSIDKARQTIERVLRTTPGVLAEPAPWVYVEELAPSSVNFAVYFWAASRQAEVLVVRDRVATGIKLALDQAQIDIPYPHTVVLLHDASRPPRLSPPTG